MVLQYQKSIKFEPLRKSDLNEQHAVSENMTLKQLHSVIGEIYPGEDQFYLFEFEVVRSV